MYKTTVKLAQAAMFATLPHLLHAQKSEKPNIILIMADDMGYSDIGCYGSEIKTPHLDRLANQGVRMTQFYNCARSCPTRASLLTGLHPHQAGVGYMIKNMGTPSYQGYLNNQCVTLAEALRMCGYSTYMSGKWHVGEEESQWPRKRGFDRFFGLISGASSYFELDKGRKMASDDDPFVPSGDNFYMTDAFGDKAVEYIEGHSADNPFFLYLAFTAPHWPLHAPQETIKKYEGQYLSGWDQLRKERYERMQRMGIVGRESALSNRYGDVPEWETLTDEQKKAEAHKMAVYAAMVDRMDYNIGRVIQSLEQRKMLDNTLIVFLSDNGACQEDPKGQRNQLKTDAPVGQRGSFYGYEYPWANAGNTPFRMFKHYVHEGGISTPLILFYPKRSNQPSINHTPGHIIDIMPTLLEAAGGKYPHTYNGHPVTPSEGMSLLPLMQKKSVSRSVPLFWEHEGNRALRDGKWKIVSTFSDKTLEFSPWELYNLEDDRSETRNLADKHPDRVAQMVRMYEQKATQAGVVPRNQLLKKQ